MSTEILSKRQIASLINSISTSTKKLQADGIPVHFFVEKSKGSPIYVGNVAMTNHIKEHLDEIASKPDYRQTPPRLAEEEVIKKSVMSIIGSFKKVETMNADDLRAFAIKLIAAATPKAKFRSRYTDESNKPNWFPISLKWKQINLHPKEDVRTIIIALYEHLDIQKPIFPVEAEKKSKKTVLTQTDSSSISQQQQTAGPDDLVESVCASSANTDNEHLPSTSKRKHQESSESVQVPKKKRKVAHKFKGSYLPWNPPSEAWCKLKSHLFNITVTAPNTYISTIDPKQFHIHAPPKETLSIEGDGNCFYRTVAALVTGNNNKACQAWEKVKDALFKFMREHSEVIDNLSGIQNYATTSPTRVPKQWATFNEIVAMATILDTNIAIYSDYGKIPCWKVYSPSIHIIEEPSKEDFIYMKHVNKINSCSDTRGKI